MTKITNRQELEREVGQLLALDPDLKALVPDVGAVPLRLRKPGFAGMVEVIVGQQVSRASASAIQTRLDQLVQPMEATTVHGIAEEPLIDAGLSRAKQKTIRALAAAVLNREIDLLSLCELPPETAAEKLVALHGIGPWTAEVYLLFCAGHADILPSGDIALQVAAQDHLRLADRPSPKELAALAERWSPHRGAAARILWAHYARLKDRNDVLPV
ncbi:MAG: DNA-3-methyladenine glycosylase 2 family protein [Pseudomonadota bacterium]